MPSNLFFDCEFTGLHQHTTLISLGIVDESGKKFYAETTDYDESQVDEWIFEHVIDRLWCQKYIDPPDDVTYFLGTSRSVGKQVSEWLEYLGPVEMWGDVLGYDWMLFCELFGGARNLPANVYYIPFDLATKFKEYGIDPDVDRVAFSGIQDDGVRHNALFDALVIKACHDRLSLFVPEVSYSRDANIVIGRPA